MSHHRQEEGTHAFAVRLMQHLVVPTFVLDAERRVIIWNHACERLTGVQAGEVIGTRNHWCAFYDSPRYCLADILALGRPGDLETLYAAHTEPSEHGSGLRAENWCLMPRVGERRYLAIDTGPIYDDQGKLIAVVETLRDMTEQKQAQIALQNLAARDALTGIANRRSFDSAMTLEWARAQREAQPLSLILADVDHFKRYNDHYGHPQGDECLRQVAGALASAVYRPADLAARYGGEEFAIVMPNTDASGAAAVAARVGERIRQLELAHAHSDVAEHVTLSIGVATLLPTKGKEAATLVGAADKALYAAKRAGRNRLIAYDAGEAAELPA
ncbi:MAG TPA: diguanylate cyclase [Azospira sp.]|nr:diguanylate cyclase [Azospira sp.]